MGGVQRPSGGAKGKMRTKAEEENTEQFDGPVFSHRQPEVGMEGRILWAWGKENKVTLDGKWGEGREEETIG